MAAKMLVSPKLFKFEDLNEEKDKNRLRDQIEKLESELYVKNMIIKVEKHDGRYFVLEDVDYAKAALFAGIRYIQIEIEKENI